MTVSKEQIEKWQKEHGELVIVETKTIGTIVFKTPMQEVHEGYQQKLNAIQRGDKGSHFGAATREYVLACLLGPERETVAGFFEKRPGVPNTIADQLADLANAIGEIEVKKV